MRQRSLKNDKHDDSAFRHPYGRNNDMKLDSEYSQHIPFFLTREGAEINLIGQYKGGSIFLICNGPSFVKLDHDMLKLPGIMTFGVNNGPKTFRPNFWTCVDDPARFLKSIWMDPKITKFVPQAHFEKPIFDNDKWEMMAAKVGDCPNVMGFRRNEKFQANRFLTETSLNWGNHKDFGGCRSVMLPSLRIPFLLGFRKIYLLGCDMKMSETYAYHFDEQRSKGAVNCNNTTYDRLKNEYLPELKPHFEAAGLQVFNCNPDSELKVFPFISFNDAIKEATAGIPDYRTERVWGMYSKPEEKPEWKKEAPIQKKVHLKTIEAFKNQGTTTVIDVASVVPVAPVAPINIDVEREDGPRVVSVTNDIPIVYPTVIHPSSPTTVIDDPNQITQVNSPVPSSLPFPLPTSPVPPMPPRPPTDKPRWDVSTRHSQ